MTKASTSSTSGSEASSIAKAPRLALWSLLIGNLFIGTGFQMPVGILHLIAEAQAVSVARAGALMWAGGITLAIGAPAMAWLTSRIDRRKLLAVALLVYVIGHALSAIAADFNVLLGLRLLTLMGAAIFGAQSVATVGLLVPPEQRASAIAFVFIGWSAAAATAVPLSSWLGAVAGWEAAFWFVAAGSCVALFLVASVIPSGLRIPPVSLKTWIEVARDPVLPVILLVTVLMMTGMLTYYTFMAADVERRLDPSPALIPSLLACFGVAGLIGTILTSKAAESMPPGRLLLVALGIMASGLLVLALAPPQPIYYVVGFTVWGLAAFSVQPLQQGRLVAARPPLASATAALNSTAINLGQALGGGLGAYVISIGKPGLLAWLAALLTISAMGLSWLTDRKVAVVVRE